MSSARARTRTGAGATLSRAAVRVGRHPAPSQFSAPQRARPLRAARRCSTLRAASATRPASRTEAQRDPCRVRRARPPTARRRHGRRSAARRGCGAHRGMSRRSRIRSLISSSKSRWLSAYRNGWFQKEPMYTRQTSGDLKTLPRDHISAPYTRISCCALIWSALLSTTRTLSSCPRSASTTDLNSSEMSSLCASKSSKIMSARAANHSATPTML